MFEGWKAKRLVAGLVEDVPPGVVEEFKALGEAGVDALVAGLRNSSAAVRAGVVRVLGELGPARAIVPLAACAGELPQVAAALRKIGARTVRPRVLRGVGAHDTEGVLAALLTSSDAAVRAQAEAALAAAGPRAVAALAAAFETEELRNPAAGVLGRMGPSGIAALVSLLGHKRKEARRQAASALSSVGWRPAGPAEEASQAAALEDWRRCGELGEAAVEPLVALLADSESEVRQAAARVLGELKDRRAAPALIGVLDDRKEAVKLAAIEALGQIGDPQAEEPLSAFLRTSYDLRAAALEALRRMNWQPQSVEDRVLFAVLSADRGALSEPAARRLLIEAACERDYSSLPEAIVVRGLGMLDGAEPELLAVLKRGGSPAAVACEILNECRGADQQYVLCSGCLVFLGTRADLRSAGGRLRCSGCGTRILL